VESIDEHAVPGTQIAYVQSAADVIDLAMKTADPTILNPDPHILMSPYTYRQLIQSNLKVRHVLVDAKQVDIHGQLTEKQGRN
jgi:hypothetical protein